jgi:hypothetical protein
MDTPVLIWIIVGIIVVVLVIVGIVYFMRGRTEQRQRAEHEKAEKLRADARASELAAREGEARAAQAKADAASAAAAAQQAQARAAQADVDSRRLADTVDEHEADAAKHRAEQDEILRKADDVDPFVTTDGTARTSNDGRADMDGDGRADTGRNDATVADHDETVDRSQTITRPPADSTAPAATHDDPLVDDVPETRRDRADRI